MVVQKQIQTPLRSHRVILEARDKLHPLCCCCCQCGNGQTVVSEQSGPRSRRGSRWTAGRTSSVCNIPAPTQPPRDQRRGAHTAGAISGPLSRCFLLNAQTRPCSCAGGNAAATHVLSGHRRGRQREQPEAVSPSHTHLLGFCPRAKPSPSHGGMSIPG